MNVGETLRPMMRDLMRVDRSKIGFATPARNAIGVLLPLAIAAWTGHLLAGVTIATGALNIAFSDRPGPYLLRAQRMLLATLVGALSVFSGAITGRHPELSIPLMALWGLAAGLVVSLGPAVEQMGITAIVLLVVYTAYPQNPEGAFGLAGYMVLGGVLQTLFAVLAWPFRQFGPEREALAGALRALASEARRGASGVDAPPATTQISAASLALMGLGSAYGETAERFRVLLDQVERVRLELVALESLRRRAEASEQSTLVQAIEGARLAAADLLDELAGSLSTDQRMHDPRSSLRQIEAVVNGLAPDENPLTREVWAHMEALLGQLRACVDVIQEGNLPEDEPTVARKAALPTQLKLRGSLATLRANFTPRSAAFRHALRLAVGLTLTALVGQLLGLGHAYWVPMTLAIVLKPDFSSTFSRGVLRMLGTLAGLLLATVLVTSTFGHISDQIALIAVLVFLIRSVGPANFGISAVAITAMVVLLTSLAGTAPGTTIAQRGPDTLVGGAIALVIYLVWPTWERTQIWENLAKTLDSYRTYFDAVMAAYFGHDGGDLTHRQAARLAARLARSNSEASVERLRAEPLGNDAEIERAESVLANSNRLAQGAMALEAGLLGPQPPAAPKHAAEFAGQVDSALETLSGWLRGNLSSFDAWPDLRQCQEAMRAEHGDGIEEFVAQTERITNSLNTLAEVIEEPATVRP